ncbi:hypothetical protein SAMD00019534_093950 [Acytostelium subglobosum LB1]|uniref:hypothetical protein n=1 Tax=Acytostelium subglobosum LB1 TaxID=1410327 RepID=UPI000644BF98|nr:hypothetical protein SAMD00019534_093950 [Acytostelium subglobosum LB1]GAM26220.1 hypothetical protein SAMD00019534_093950 [Acytostelium subglobosum LB1]|eukprot:XP_012750774.1 hypothetical protein SAMD00019534_093950 [Acytostelium subglobosum LB1]
MGKVSNSTTQTIISLFYGVLQALISLVFGIMFIFLGVKINKLLGPWKVKTKGILGVSARKLKLLAVTVSCSSGLILHSIFVLVLITSSQGSNNSTFSFIFLILTEVFPAIAMYIYYNQTKLSPSTQGKRSSTSVTGGGNKMQAFS